MSLRLALHASAPLRGLSALVGILCQPWIAGPAVLALTYGPREIRDPLVELISRQTLVSVETVVRTLKTLFGVGVVATVHRLLNAWANRQWRLTAATGWQWDKEIAVVTGGSSGIGLNIVLGLVNKGVRVVVLDIQPLPEILQQQASVSFVHCDVSSTKAIEEAAETVHQSVGHPSILVNNAGMGNFESILDITDEQLKKIFNVNLLSHWTATKQFLPDMVKKNKGHIVTIASVASFAAIPRLVDYAATKAGAMAFHEGLSGEIKHIYKAPGVLTTSVHPAWVGTPMTESIAGAIEKRNGPLLVRFCSLHLLRTMRFRIKSPFRLTIHNRKWNK